MSKPKAPAFQFYASDFLGSRRVRMMTLEERGAYITLLADSWDEDGLPGELSEVASLLGMKENSAQFKRIWARVGPAFERVGDRLRNPRQERERSKQAENRAKKVKAAESRWGHECERNASAYADAYADASVVQCSPIPSPSPSPTNNTHSLPERPKKRETGTALPDSVMEWCKRQDKPAAWIAALLGMLKGVGAPGGKPVTMGHIAESCSVADRLKGDCTPARFGRILVRVMEPEYKSTAHGSSDDVEFVTASKRLRTIASYRDPVRTQSLSAEGWKIITPQEREALQHIGTIERVLTAKPEQWSFVVRDFLKAQRGAAA